jgi:hypothetical protein
MMGGEWGKYEVYDALWDDPLGPLDNQPEWTRGKRGVQQEARVQQECEAPADGRHRRDERRHDNQPEKMA